MSGLRPGAVAPDGTVASLKSGAASVLGVNRGTVLPTKELVSVGYAVLAREAASVMVTAGLQMLKLVVVPKGAVIGSGATRGGGLMEGEGTMEEDGEGIKANGEVIGSGVTTGGELTEGEGLTEDGYEYG